MSHTPGPWETREIAGNGANIPARMEIVAPEGEGAKKLIANIYGFSLPTGRANARLIAAAPEMYEALEELRDKVWRIIDLHRDSEARAAANMALERANAALAKARGDEGEENA